MNMKYIKMRIITVLALVLVISACTKDLDTVPLDKDVLTSAAVYDDFSSYKLVLAKLYAGLSVSGQSGPHGNNDLSGLDEGFGQYLRAYWYAQELATDECIIAWNDGNLKDYHEQDWTSSNEFITNMYYRLFYQIALSNEFIRETADSKLNERGLSQAEKDEVKGYQAEARFLRALSYWHALDLFGNVPFVTEEDAVGSFFPEQIQRSDLFDYVESELLAIEDLLPGPGMNEYARADQGALWMLLAKLYLNAEVYTGTGKYTETITYAKKVIDQGGYSLETTWENLFLADNHTADGVIFPIAFDGVRTRTWGGTTFIVNASIGGTMVGADYGVAGGWAGIRVTKEIVGKFFDLETLKKKGDMSGRKAFDYPVLYVPGAHQGWNPADTTTVIASVNDDGNYEGYLWFADAGNAFKFTVGPSWAVNYGDNGADGTLEPGGADIVAGDAGYYKLNVDTNAWTYTIEKTEWGLIGDATPGGWGSDTDMTYNVTDGVWELEVDLGTGAIKFRANDDWAINYGDTGVDGILEAGGDNISIAEAGAYLIKMKLGFPDYTYTIEKFSSDNRGGLFYSDGQSLEIDDVFEFTEGYALTKFKNITSTGSPGSDQTHPDTDFPMFRLADAYLMYAEAVLRGGSGGDAATALSYVNMLRERAYGDDYGNIDSDDLDLDFILDERAREFLWEAQRRTDLVRFGKFSDTDYMWAWKGGVKEGRSVQSYFDLYPLPASDVAANKNLTQNDGYN
jgi:hypothetical protein